MALSVGGYVAQILLEYVLTTHDEAHLLWQWFALDGASIAAGQYWKFLTYSALHFNPVQLIANMLLLVFAGREVEAILGRRHFLTIYGVGTLLGGVVSWLVLPGLPLVGTTAAVLAVVVAYSTVLP